MLHPLVDWLSPGSTYRHLRENIRYIIRTHACGAHGVKSILYPCDQAESYHFRGRRKRTPQTLRIQWPRTTARCQRMTSDWQIVNRCQLNSFQRPDTRWRHRKFADEFDTGLRARHPTNSDQSTEDFHTFARNSNSEFTYVYTGKTCVKYPNVGNALLSFRRWNRFLFGTYVKTRAVSTVLEVNEIYVGHSQSGCIHKNDHLHVNIRSLPIT